MFATEFDISSVEPDDLGELQVEEESSDDDSDSDLEEESEVSGVGVYPSTSRGDLIVSIST